jgi:predicted O-methyltransferase YrrM
MHKTVRGDAKRVLAVGAPADDAPLSPEAVLAREGMLIIMEEDAGRAAELRLRAAKDGVSHHTVISGDPRRVIYKLAGPFDVIFCTRAYVSLRPQLEKLLARDGVFIIDGEPAPAD